MVLLRKVIGDALRARRLAQHCTLREVSTAANVSLGYLSEIERGHKEASSELLASICDALGARLSEMLGDVSATFALAEQMETLPAPADQQPVEANRALDEAIERVTRVLAWPDEEAALNFIGPTRGGGWIAEEAIAMALYCVMRHPSDYVAAVRLAPRTSGPSSARKTSRSGS